VGTPGDAHWPTQPGQAGYVSTQLAPACSSGGAAGVPPLADDLPQMLVGIPWMWCGGTPHWPSQSACLFRSAAVEVLSTAWHWLPGVSLFHWIRALLGPQGTPSYSTELEPHTGEVRLTVTWGRVDASTQAEAVVKQQQVGAMSRRTGV